MRWTLQRPKGYCFRLQRCPVSMRHHVRSLTRPSQMWFPHAFQSLHFDDSLPSPGAKPAQSKVCAVGPFEATLPPPCVRLMSMASTVYDLPYQLALSAHMQHRVDAASSQRLEQRPHREPATGMHTPYARAKTLEHAQELSGPEQMTPEGELRVVVVTSPRALECGHCNAQTGVPLSTIDGWKSQTPCQHQRLDQDMSIPTYRCIGFVCPASQCRGERRVPSVMATSACGLLQHLVLVWQHGRVCCVNHEMPAPCLTEKLSQASVG